MDDNTSNNNPADSVLRHQASTVYRDDVAKPLKKKHSDKKYYQHSYHPDRKKPTDEADTNFQNKPKPSLYKHLHHYPHRSDNNYLDHSLLKGHHQGSKPKKQNHKTHDRHKTEAVDDRSTGMLSDVTDGEALPLSMAQLERYGMMGEVACYAGSMPTFGFLGEQLPSSFSQMPSVLGDFHFAPYSAAKNPSNSQQFSSVATLESVTAAGVANAAVYASSKPMLTAATSIVADAQTSSAQPSLQSQLPTVAADAGHLDSLGAKPKHRDHASKGTVKHQQNRLQMENGMSPMPAYTESCLLDYGSRVTRKKQSKAKAFEKELASISVPDQGEGSAQRQPQAAAPKNGESSASDGAANAQPQNSRKKNRNKYKPQTSDTAANSKADTSQDVKITTSALDSGCPTASQAASPRKKNKNKYRPQQSDAAVSNVDAVRDVIIDSSSRERSSATVTPVESPRKKNKNKYRPQQSDAAVSNVDAVRDVIIDSSSRERSSATVTPVESSRKKNKNKYRPQQSDAGANADTLDDVKTDTNLPESGLVLTAHVESPRRQQKNKKKGPTDAAVKSNVNVNHDSKAVTNQTVERKPTAVVKREEPKPSNAHQKEHKSQSHNQGRKSQNDNNSGKVVEDERARSRNDSARANQPQGNSNARNQDRSAANYKSEQSAKQGNVQRKKSNSKKVFEPYWSLEDVQRGLKEKTLIQGTLRINPKNFEDAYVPHNDLKSDVYLNGYRRRNRALNGDIVAVLLDNRDEWKLQLDTLQDASGKSEMQTEAATDSNDPKQQQAEGVKPKATSPPKNQSNKSPRKRYISVREYEDSHPTGADCDGSSSSLSESQLLRTGKVVYIIEKKHSRACTGNIRHMTGGNKHQTFFVPSDHRMPRIIVPMAECPQGFRERPEDFASALFIARIKDWPEDAAYANGQLARSLGEAGEIEPETEGILIEHDVDYAEFSNDVLACLPSMPWSIPAGEFSRRRDLRRQCIFTIDPPTARDMDDAVSCETISEGVFEVGVHIADVTHFVKPDTALDKIAASRSTSVYLVQRVVPMLPRLLCDELCSLNPGTDRLCFSVIWQITVQGEILSEWFGLTIIHSCAKLSYDHAQGFIDNPERQWKKDELPQLYNGYTSADIVSRTLNLHKIAVNLRQQRFQNGALRLDQVKLQYVLNRETGMPIGFSVYQQKESNRLIEEFMLLANMAVAHKIYKAHPQHAVLRRHPPPQARVLDSLNDLCSNIGLLFSTTCAGAIQESIDKLTEAGLDERAKVQVLNVLASKPMQLAVYFCTGCLDDEALYRHYALNVPLYTHFTSPIRRYPDILVHRLLASAIGVEPMPSRDASAVELICQNANDRKLAAKKCSELSSQLFFSLFVKECGPLEEQGMVMAVLDQSFDVLVLKLGVVKRVYCEMLPLARYTYRKPNKCPELVLTWAAGDGHPTAVQQVITYFTPVTCLLVADKQPLKWTATIKHPDDCIAVAADLDSSPVSDAREVNEELDLTDLSISDNIDASKSAVVSDIMRDNSTPAAEGQVDAVEKDTPKMNSDRVEECKQAEASKCLDLGVELDHSNNSTKQSNSGTGLEHVVQAFSRLSLDSDVQELSLTDADSESGQPSPVGSDAATGNVDADDNVQPMPASPPADVLQSCDTCDDQSPADCEKHATKSAVDSVDYSVIESSTSSPIFPSCDNVDSQPECSAIESRDKSASAALSASGTSDEEP